MDSLFQGLGHDLSGLEGEIAPADLYWLAGRIQDHRGGIPRSAVAELAARSGVPEARLWGALTAYPRLRIVEGA